MKFEITWVNNGKTFSRIVNKSNLANTITELAMWGHTLMVKELH